MLSKAKIKEIRSLEIKKYRNELNLFVAEGNKLVSSMLPTFECALIVARSSWLASRTGLRAKEIVVADGDDMRKASLLKTPQDVIALFRKPAYSINDVHPGEELVLALDGIQDPGNLGTIIRLADWFGIGHIVCSHDTNDAFSPKTVQATMGALARVKVHYADLPGYIIRHRNVTPIYGTFLDGNDMYSEQLTGHGIIVMGNEGNGIRPETEKLITKRLFIPPYPSMPEKTESLNVAVATAIVCAEFRRISARL